MCVEWMRREIYSFNYLIYNEIKYSFIKPKGMKLKNTRNRRFYNNILSDNAVKYVPFSEDILVYNRINIRNNSVSELDGKIWLKDSRGPASLSGTTNIKLIRGIIYELENLNIRDGYEVRCYKMTITPSIYSNLLEEWEDIFKIINGISDICKNEDIL